MQAEADERRSHIYMVRSSQIDTRTSPPRCGCNGKRHSARRCWYLNGKGPELIDSFYSYVLSNNFYYYHDRINEVEEERVRKKKKKTSPVFLIVRNVEEEKERARKKKTSPVFLSPDILMDIISRLPATSILILRSVSRDWNAVSRNPLIAAAQIAYAKRAHLAIHSGEERQEVHLISTPDRPGTASVVFRLKPLPKDIVVLGSSNGILCLQERLGNFRGRLYLYNPLLGGDPLPLPMDGMLMLFPLSKCGFGFDQVTSEFKVVLMRDNYIKEHGMKISIHACVVPMVGGSLGNPRPWTLLKEEVFDWDRWFSHLHDGPLTLVNGKLHCLVDFFHPHGRIVAFDIVSHAIAYIDFFHFPNIILRIGELGDHLFAITSESGMFNDYNIWVMKDYGKLESMTKEIVLPQQYIIPLMIPYMLNEHEIFLRDSQEGVPYMVQHNPTLVSTSVGIQRTGCS